MGGEAQENSCSTSGDEPCEAMSAAHDDAMRESGCNSGTMLAVAPTSPAQPQENEAITAHARGIGHDLNNLLAVITTYTRLVLEDLEADDPSRPDLEEVCAAADRACLLARQLSMLGHESASPASPI